MALRQNSSSNLPHLLTLVRQLPAAQQSLFALALQYHPDMILPTTASLDEAMALVLADICSLSRAAELANVTRWDLLDALNAHGVALVIDSHFTVDEMDDLADRLEQRGLL
jgi:predicted HTH domain antitoxin